MKNPTFNPMKIAVLGSRGIPNRYGGFEEMAAQVCPLWVKEGHQVTVYAISDHPDKQDTVDGVRIIHIFNPEKTLGLAGQFIYDFLGILHARKENYDVILQLGYTTSGIWSFLWPKHKTITNMDGLEHKRAKYKGLLSVFLKWSERRAVKGSKLLVADNPEIASYLKKFKKPIQTIAYGTEVVSFEPKTATLLEPFDLTSKEYHLHIGRVQPDNHVHEILSAAEDSGETLVTIGDYSTRYGRTLKGAFDHCRNIHFLGSIYDKTLLNALRQHSLFYIHGHSAGGTNPALLEALGCGCFVLAHGNAFNGSVLGGLGGLWLQSDQLSAQLQQRPSKETLAQQQELARERMKTHFQWMDIAAQYIDAFQELEK